MAYRRTEETALCLTGHARNGILFIGMGLAYHKTEETDLLQSKRGPVDREGWVYRKMEETDLCWSSMVETGVMFIRRGVAYRKMGLHGILFMSTCQNPDPMPHRSSM